MSDLISLERTKYEEMWTIESYAKNSPGEQFVTLFHDIVTEHSIGLGSVIDAGCGQARGTRALEGLGYSVIGLCDVTDAALPPEYADRFFQCALWDNLQHRADYVFCCDVLEHIPMAFTGLTIQRLLDSSREGVFLSVSTVPDTFGRWIGQTLHETVQPFTWWRDLLSTLGNIVVGRDLLLTAVFFVRPR